MKLIPIDWLPNIPSGLYSASADGRIWSTESEQFLKPQDNKGYDEVDLRSNGYRAKCKVHRLICQAFYGPPPNPESQVDHIDMDRRNNSLTNLEWVSRSENIRRRNASGSDPGGKAKKPIVIANTTTNTCYIAQSHKEAQHILGMHRPAFYEALKNNAIINKSQEDLRLLKIENLEVLHNVRNKNKSEHSQATRSTTAESSDTARTGINPDRDPITRPTNRPHSNPTQRPSEEGQPTQETSGISSLARETLEKWKVIAEKGNTARA